MMRPQVTSIFVSSLREAGVVVFSILLAFTLDSWWDGLQEVRQADALAAAVREELAVNGASLTESVSRHRAIADAIAAAQRAGSTEAVHTTAVIERELWEPRTAALDAFLALQSQSTLSDSELRVQLGTVLELLRKYRQPELRAAEFQDRARERIAEMGLPIYQDDDARGAVSSDQVMLNYLSLRRAEELAAIEAADPLAAGIQNALEALPQASRP